MASGVATPGTLPSTETRDRPLAISLAGERWRRVAAWLLWGGFGLVLVLAASAPVARTGDGLPRLAAAVSDALSHDFLDLEFRFSVSNGRLLAYLAKYGEVISRTFSGDRATVHCRLSRKHLGALRDDPEIEIHPYVASSINRHGAEGAVGEVA